VETKKRGTNPAAKVDGIDQLKTYMASCLNAQYGLWTNGDDRYCFAKRSGKGAVTFEDIIDIPAFGQSEADAQRPKRKDLKPATADNLCSLLGAATTTLRGRRGNKSPMLFGSC
jgi:type I restriction enzyme M protein